MEYWYFTHHGVQPGSIPKDAPVLDLIDTPDGTYFKTDRVFSTKELQVFDLKEKMPAEIGKKTGTAGPYLIESLKRSTKDTAVYWGPGERGYTADVLRAGFYSGPEAEAIAGRAGNVRMVPLTPELLQKGREQCLSEIDRLERGITGLRVELEAEKARLSECGRMLDGLREKEWQPDLDMERE